ncbi:MAG: two-component system activity regulator YycH, partial [Tumebacillaceae bacterium]
MKEQFKTYILAGLVITSVLLTLNIWSIAPKYEAVDAPQFASNIALNDPSYQRTLGNVVIPGEIIAHFGDDKHSALFPGQSGYESALGLLRQASLSDVSITTDYGEAEWNKIVRETPSLQFNFDATLPGSVLEDANLMRLNARLESTLQMQSLYLFRLPGDADLRALFYGGEDQPMYTARVVVNKDLYSKLFQDLKDEPPYNLYGQSLYRNFYLPATRQKWPSYNLSFGLDTDVQRLANSFFIDKSMTRRVIERDGSQIITDGSRLVRLSAREHLVDYRNLDLERPQNQNFDADFGILKALSFVNEHGGFTGQVVMHENPLLRPEQKIVRRSYQFRQTLSGLPLIGNLTSVYVNVLGYDVLTMRRSQFALVGKPYREESGSDVLSGPEVLKLVEDSAWLDRNRVTNVYLAYLMGDAQEQ